MVKELNIWKIKIILIGIVLAIGSFQLSLTPTSLPFNPYEFEISAPEGTYVRNYSIFYDFNENKGNINFKVGGSKALKAIDIHLPQELSISNIRVMEDYTKNILIENISIMEEREGRKVWNQSIYVENDTLDIREVEGTLAVFIEVYSPNESFYPNGLFKLMFRISDITPREISRNEILTFNLGGYRCGSAFFVPEKLDSRGIIPNCNEELLQLYINPNESSNKINGTNRFILNSYNYDLKVWNDIFRSLAISILAGTILFFLQQMPSQKLK